MTASLLPAGRLALALAVTSTLVAVTPPVAAALAPVATTDDRSTTVPTVWWTDQNLTPQEVAERLALRRARLVGLDVTAVGAGGEPRFATRMVPDQGAYGVPGWSWHYDLTAAGITALLNANTGRLIEVERYDRGGGQLRYAVVMVSNTGSAARTWSYLLDATPAQVQAHLTRSASRPIDLDVHGSGSGRRLDAVFVANTGADLRPFDWALDQTATQITARVQAFQGRVVELTRQSDGRYAFVQVRNTGSDAAAAWHRHGFTSLGALEDFARQMAARPVDMVSYFTLNGRRWDAAFIDNANAETARLRGEFAQRFIDAEGNPRGIFQAYLKQVGGPVLVDLNSRRRAETASALKVLHLLHAMREVQAGRDTLASAFDYWNYEYPSSELDPKDRCPEPAQESRAEQRITETLERGLDRMMEVSDNRTTRGVVLRYGGYGPLNDTAAWAGLRGTTLRHDIGCAYWDWDTASFAPAKRRNDTTAADLASVYEGVWTGRLLDDTNRARAEFLESTAAPAGDLGARMRAMIREEAEAQGKGAIADAFADLVKRWAKGGSYTGVCLGDPDDATQCGYPYRMVRATAGLMRFPIRSGPYTAFRYYSYGSLISDVPYSSSTTRDQDEDAYGRIRVELLRSAVRDALRTW